MAKIYAIVNQKGGVGKTTTTANLGAALAARGRRVLLIDLDAQANLSAHYGISQEDSSERGTMYEVLRHGKKLVDVILPLRDNLAIAPASLLLSAADLELGGVIGRELLLRKAVQPIADQYDYVLIDCPPSLGMLSLNGLVAASRVIVPVQSEYLALHGVRQLLDTIDQVRSAYNPALAVGGVLICLFDQRKRLARSVADTVREYFGDLVFKTYIRSNVALAESPAQGSSIFDYDSRSTGAEDYANLAEEVDTSWERASQAANG
ncbi:MAG: ParA family protein [Deltaproteobacteria bacterium]|nr:ParA family protein [Deltaproteobacteria bacterium]